MEALPAVKTVARPDGPRLLTRMSLRLPALLPIRFLISQRGTFTVQDRYLAGAYFMPLVLTGTRYDAFLARVGKPSAMLAVLFLDREWNMA